MAERGVSVDHSTIWRWVDRFAPELEQRRRRHCSRESQSGGLMKLTSALLGKWTYLYRAVDGGGATVEFYLSETRDLKAAKLFFRKR
jgi:transposase-like protein